MNWENDTFLKTFGTSGKEQWDEGTVGRVPVSWRIGVGF